jgi:hypothetical protein
MTPTSLSALRPEVAAPKKLDAFVEYDCIPAEKEFEEHLKARHGSQRWTMRPFRPARQTKTKVLKLWTLESFHNFI